MSDDFIRLVASMRAAQKEFFEMHTRSSMTLAVKLETQVDKYIQQWTAEKVQLDFWTRSVKGSELPGVYDVGNDGEKTNEAQE